MAWRSLPASTQPILPCLTTFVALAAAHLDLTNHQIIAMITGVA